MAAAIAATLDGSPDVGVKISVAGTGFQNLASFATISTTLTGNNNDIVGTAVLPGTDGNLVSLTLVDPGGTTATLGVVVTGNDIVVNLGRAGSAINTTGTLLLAALAASPAAVALATFANKAANDGTGLVTALTKTQFTGGTDAAFVDVTIEEGVGPVVSHHIATDGSGAISLAEKFEVSEPGIVTIKGTVSGVVQASTTVKINSN